MNNDKKQAYFLEPQHHRRNIANHLIMFEMRLVFLYFSHLFFLFSFFCKVKNV
eukprot:UN25768